jgi:hypothetical protein
MYLRPPSKWKNYLLQEGIEDIGLPPEVAHYLRQQNQSFGPVSNKHLTWIGRLIKAVKSSRFFDAGVYQVIVEEIVPLHAFPRTPEGEEAWSKSLEFFKDWYINHSGTRGLASIGDVKALKKSARKMLKKLNAPEDAIKQLDSFLDYRMKRGTTALQQHYRPIMELLTEDPPFYEELLREVAKVLDHGDPSNALRAASQIAKETLANPPKNEDQVIHTFDDGYYWYDLRKSACDIEGRTMKHCGSADRGTLYSLRTGEKRRDIKRYITLSMDEGRTVYQIKGKGNTAPPEELWPYIDAFIENAEVKRIAEVGMHSSDGIGFAEMLQYLKQKYGKEGTGQVKFDDSWVDEATELLEQYAPDFDSDDQTSVDVSWPSVGDEEVTFTLKHQAFFPVKDVIVDEDTHRLRWEIRQDAESIADDTLYPNPRIRTVEVYARGKEDSRSAMLGISMAWEGLFFADDENEDDVKSELAELNSFLAEMSEISAYLISNTEAPEEAEFDYNEFYERIEKRLEAYGVYRDIAGEDDRETEREREKDRGQMDLGLWESRIVQRWSKIIK